MALPNDYWENYHHPVESADEYLEAVQKISAYQQATDSRFVWRGVADASWAMHPSLVRDFADVHGRVPRNESALRELEREVIQEARSWGLDWHFTGGHLSALELLAAMQHYGAPTRLLDFTFNPFIALWFAVEGGAATSGRVFAVDIAGRLLSPEQAARRDPWWFDLPTGATTDWTTRPWIWQPPPLEPRMTRQEGCFLMGGIPSSNPGRRLGTRMLSADEIRECMTVPFQLIKYDKAEAAAEGRQMPGQKPKSLAFTLTINNKTQVRESLVQMFDYSHRSLFPDYPGFAAYGVSWR
jgi:hypothetical protein